VGSEMCIRDRRGAGYVVYPVNPRGGAIDGVTVYPRLIDLPQLPDVVDIVVPPSVTETIVREAYSLGLSRIWMQPGAESRTAIEYCRAHGLEVVYDACAMVYAHQWQVRPGSSAVEQGDTAGH